MAAVDWECHLSNPSPWPISKFGSLEDYGLAGFETWIVPRSLEMAK